MDLELGGKWVLVVGGSKGIGLATAKAFAREGANLFLVARDEDQLERARRDILEAQTESSIDVEIHPADMSESTMATTIADRCRRADVLVNSVSAIPAGPIELIDEAAWRKGWELKVFGYINVTREMLKHMYGRGSGVVVNVVGTVAAKPNYNSICGSAGGAAVSAFTRALGAHSVDKGVRVLGINPTATRTDRIVEPARSRAGRDLGDESRWRETLPDLPFGRLCEPDEVADLIVYLASARASYISGTVVDLDGGALLR